MARNGFDGTSPAPRRPIPLSALTLGVGGLIPFAAAAGAFAFADPRLGGPALLALLTYSAAILSFLGGVRWGAEIMSAGEPRWLAMVGAVLPALVAWALLSAPFPTPEWQLGCFAAAFLGCWLWDLRSDQLPPWYKRLRNFLTLGAVACLLLALWRALSLGG